MGRSFWPSAVEVDDDVIAGLANSALVSEQAVSELLGKARVLVQARVDARGRLRDIAPLRTACAAPTRGRVDPRGDAGSAGRDDRAGRVSLRPGISVRRGRRRASSTARSRRCSRPPMPSPVVGRSHPHRALSTVPWSLHRTRRYVAGPCCWRRGSTSTAATIAMPSPGSTRSSPSRRSGQRGAARRRSRLEGTRVLAARRLA